MMDEIFLRFSGENVQAADPLHDQEDEIARRMARQGSAGRLFKNTHYEERAGDIAPLEARRMFSTIGTVAQSGSLSDVDTVLSSTIDTHMSYCDEQVNVRRSISASRINPDCGPRACSEDVIAPRSQTMIDLEQHFHRKSGGAESRSSYIPSHEIYYNDLTISGGTMLFADDDTVEFDISRPSAFSVPLEVQEGDVSTHMWESSSDDAMGDGAPWDLLLVGKVYAWVLGLAGTCIMAGGFIISVFMLPEAAVNIVMPLAYSLRIHLHLALAVFVFDIFPLDRSVFAMLISGVLWWVGLYSIAGTVPRSLMRYVILTLWLTVAMALDLLLGWRMENFVRIIKSFSVPTATFGFLILFFDTALLPWQKRAIMPRPVVVLILGTFNQAAWSLVLFLTRYLAQNLIHLPHTRRHTEYVLTLLPIAFRSFFIQFVSSALNYALVWKTAVALLVTSFTLVWRLSVFKRDRMLSRLFLTDEQVHDYMHIDGRRNLYTNYLIHEMAIDTANIVTTTVLCLMPFSPLDASSVLYSASIRLVCQAAMDLATIAIMLHKHSLPLWTMILQRPSGWLLVVLLVYVCTIITTYTWILDALRSASSYVTP